MDWNYKFRAWDKVNKKLRNVRGVDWEEGLVFFRYCRENQGLTVQYPGSDCQGLASVHLMLYSPFLDNSGNRICEEDIFIANRGSRDEWYGLVAFENGGFVVNTSWMLCETAVPTPLEYRPPLKYYADADFVELEVIGNIYENPDLIPGDSDEKSG